MAFNMNVIPDIYREGSVKNIRGGVGQGLWFFEFSDCYSIFDWGRMPDELPGKGKALALSCLAIYSWFEKKEAWSSLSMGPKNSKISLKWLEWLGLHGLKGHLKGPWNERGPFFKPISEIGGHIFLAFTPFNVIRPTWEESTSRWDYSCFKKKPSEGMVPLEVVFRFGMPQGSSFKKRMNDLHYLKTLSKGQDLSEEEFESLVKKDNRLWDFPFIEFSTKWEPEDRYLSYAEAQEMAGLSDGEFLSLCELNRLVAYQLRDLFSCMDLTLWDGKCEWAFSEEKGPFEGQRTFTLVDSLGPDELRLSYKGLPFSKEAIRKVYRNSEWALEIEKAKEESREEGHKDWKSLYFEKASNGPRSLGAKEKEIFSMIYLSLSNTLCEKLLKVRPFPEAWSLDKVGKTLSHELGEKQ